MKWKPGSKLLGDRRPADEVAALDDEHLQAGLREVGAVDESVVPAADDDRVVVLVRRCHGQAVFRGGLKKRQPGDVGRHRLVVVVDGELEVDPRTRRRRAPVGTRAIAMWRCSIGEYIRLVA